MLTDMFDVNIYNPRVIGYDGTDYPVGAVKIAVYGMTQDEEGFYSTLTQMPLATAMVIDPEYLEENDEDTWVYSNTPMVGGITGRIARALVDELLGRFNASA